MDQNSKVRTEPRCGLDNKKLSMHQNVDQLGRKSKFFQSLWSCWLKQAVSKTSFIFSLGPSHGALSNKHLKLSFNFFRFCFNMEQFYEKLVDQKKKALCCVSKLQKSICSACSEREITVSSLRNFAMSRILAKQKSNKRNSRCFSWCFWDKNLRN